VIGNIPSQENANLDIPEEHFVWALRNMPTFAGVGAVTHSGFLRLWSKHLWKCAFFHRDWLVRLADENGNIHVSKLPRQQIKFQQAVRGPNHQYNNAAGWVSVDTPAPEPIRIPDIKELTIQENAAMLRQYEDAGMLSPYTPPLTVAEAIND
jgi:hypothetical protein